MLTKFEDDSLPVIEVCPNTSATENHTRFGLYTSFEP